MSDSRTSPAGTPSPTDPAVRAAVAAWVERAASADDASALAAVVARVAAHQRRDVALEIDGAVVDPDPDVAGAAVPAAALTSAGPWLPGLVREALLGAEARARGGVHHTAPAVASVVVDLAASVRPFSPDAVVLDPAVGGGAFLLAAAQRMSGNVASRVRRLRGVDIDPLAAAVARAALRLWAGPDGVADDAIRTGDGLLADWAEPVTHVVGNPPFLSQLKLDTARDAARRVELRARWPALGAYTDDAVAFLLSGVEQVVDGGVVALILPTSMLAARDAAPARAHLATVAPPAAVWLDGGRRFAAAVDTVGLVVRRGGAPGAPVRRVLGLPPETAEPVVVDDESWAALLLADEVPEVSVADLSTAGTIGDIAEVTAGFRDQFYGLRDAVHEDPDSTHRLITSGLIDPLEDRWGATDCRFDRRSWRHPGVDPELVDPGIRDWVRARLVPKVLVASQTKTIEVLVDRDGSCVPCTPVVSVEPRAGAPGLDHLAAALTSPVLSALAVRGAAGSALSADSIRVSATAIAALPLPGDRDAWDRAAALVAQRRDRPEAVSVADIGRATLAAYGVEDRGDLHNWWRSRLPDR